MLFDYFEYLCYLKDNKIYFVYEKLCFGLFQVFFFFFEFPSIRKFVEIYRILSIFSLGNWFNIRWNIPNYSGKRFSLFPFKLFLCFWRIFFSFWELLFFRSFVFWLFSFLLFSGFSTFFCHFSLFFQFCVFCFWFFLFFEKFFLFSLFGFLCFI